MTRTVAAAGALLSLAALVGCGPSAKVTQMESNESSLREMVASDRQQIEGLQEKLKRQNDRLAELEHQDETANADDEPKAPPSPAAVASGAPAEVQAGPPPAAQASPGSDSGENLAGPTPAATPTPGPNLAAVAPPAPPVEPSVPTPAAPSWQTAVNGELATNQKDPAAKLYRSGLADMRAGKFKTALTKFQDLQRRFPKSSLSEPAEYFSGNAFFEMGQHEKSILQFNDLTMRYPEGRFASASLLREAEAFVKIDDQIDARLTLQKLLNEHPTAPEAPTAKSMMASLSS